ncbi:hypothetical protein FQA39_LY10911 [Lamprigera yunnana]|nr:hypothetical protein FQA39_LY10911 [Lamprigera yunnana]
MNDLNLIAIENLREYLRIPSVHPNVDYEPCVVFLEELAKNIGLDVDVYRVLPNKPVVILTWIGTQPYLPSIMLNSHMDVVPVFEKYWVHNPFGGILDDGKIYGRGAQDTKGLGIQYLEAIRRLKRKGFQSKRTVHITFVPDEEMSGVDGMKRFVQTKFFQNLNIGFAMDEGGIGHDNQLIVFNAQKRAWKFEIHCTGQSGHSSKLLNNTPGKKISYMLNKVYEYRSKLKLLQKNKATGDVSSINLTIIKGGLQINMIPAEFVLVFDNRITLEDFEEFEKTLRQWCLDAGEGVTIKDIIKDSKWPLTKLDKTNAYWVALQRAIKKRGMELVSKTLFATSDARYLQAKGIPALGFSPNSNMEIKIHGNNEYTTIDSFLNGIKILMDVIIEITNV